MYLLDTNIVSELRKLDSNKINPNVQKWAEQVDFDKTFISVITISEIQMDILRLAQSDKQQANMLVDWFENQVLSEYQSRSILINKEIALRYATLHIPNKRPVNDAFIAATALEYDFVLVTRNIKDF
ncbi:Probable ribonuclease FitB [Kingella kingae]|uniref:type II toxin-antitoxin system VapC family toxin n=1 Tax=Kingella kingae TaxID=504 RepID=UPI000E03D447|nr:type II toxin-antitoxin system VapC family toxin [Kingella kingae]QIP48091.1 type II toxin-antitoxin system VapC family toxin [Kingella kingae]STR02049.1 Probable ribonuclease FitB [Kingella kingae]